MTRRNNKKQQVETNQQLQVAVEIKKPLSKDEFSIEIGKFLLDLSKLTFAGVFLTGITDFSSENYKLVTIGGIIIMLLALAGFRFVNIGINKKK